tara:strand:+ start:2834 stop:3484 length:651 start_codon:yes stop_codon:yes gene_type:complete
MSFNNSDYVGKYSDNDVGVLVPKGSIIMMPMTVTTTEPDGFLRCDGRTLNIADYPELYALISTSFGGDGNTTFAIPNYQSFFLYGKANSASQMNLSYGNDTTTLAGANVPNHTHTFTSITHRHRKIISSKILNSAYAVADSRVAYNDDLNNSGGGPMGFAGGSRQAISDSGANTNGYGIMQASQNAYINFNNSGASSPSSFSIIPEYKSMVFLIKY